MHFELSDTEAEKVAEWLDKEVYPNVIEHQMANTLYPTPFHYDCWEMGYPYEGAIGGGLSYLISETSIGTSIKAIYEANRRYELDLTDYDSW